MSLSIAQLTRRRELAVLIGCALMCMALAGTVLSEPCVDYRDSIRPISFFETENAHDVVAGHHVAYVADYAGGFRIYDISTPGEEALLGSIVLRGPAWRLRVVGDRAYVTTTSATTQTTFEPAGLAIIDVHDPQNPQVIGEVELPGGAARGLAVAGTLAYVANHDAGLRIIDVSDPASPVEIGHVDTPGLAHAVAVSGGQAVVADYMAGLHVVDVSDPGAPLILGSVATPGNAFDVVLDGSHAFVADEAGGLQIVDVTDAGSPELIGGVTTTGRALAVRLSGRHACVAVHDLGLQIVDISDRTAPELTASAGVRIPAFGVDVYENLAYVAGRSGIEVIDISNPTSPPIIGSAELPKTAWRVTPSGTRAYVSHAFPYTWNPEITVVDLSDPQSPSVLATHTICDMSALVASDQYVFGACEAASGMKLTPVDFSDPLNPIVLNTHLLHGHGYDMALVDDRIYVVEAGARRGLAVFGVAEPNRIRLLGEVGLNDSGETTAVAVMETLAVTASYLALSTVDVSDPESMHVLGSVDLEPGNVHDIALEDGFAFLAGRPGLKVVDVRAPEAPVQVAELRLVDGARRLIVRGNHAYLATLQGLAVVDVAHPTQPELVGYGGHHTYDVLALGDDIVTAGRTLSTHAPQCADPSSPLLLTSFTTEPTDDSVLLRWTTSPEARPHVFVLHRSTQFNTGFVRINAELIAGPGPYEYRDHDVIPEERYWYRLEAIDLTGESELFGPFGPVGIEPAPPPIPPMVLRVVAFPNPCRFDPAPIEFLTELPRSTAVRLRIHDVSGRLVHAEVTDALDAGIYRLRWDGADTRGVSVASGHYFYEVDTDEGRRLGTITVLR